MPLSASASSWRVAALLLAALAYAALSHVLMLYAGDQPWAVAVLLGPALLALLALATARGHRGAVLGALAALAVLAALTAHGAISDVNRLYLAQHAGIHLALGASFACTMREGGQPAITAIATRVHGALPQPMQAYTRKVTGLWALYFFGMAVLSVGIYAHLSWNAWSLFANLITPGTVVCVFVGEYLVRYVLHPEFERASLTATLRICSAGPSCETRSAAHAGQRGAFE